MAAVIFVVVAVVGVLDVVADVVGVLVVAVVFGVDVVDVDGAVVTVVGVPAGVVVMLQGGDRRGRKMDNYFLTLKIKKVFQLVINQLAFYDVAGTVKNV